MPFKIRRSINIAPGLRFNLGKRSMSVSVGVKGAHVTMRPGRTARTTIGLPGSGLNFTTGGQTAAKPHELHPEAPGAAQTSIAPEAIPKGNAARGWLWLSLIIVIAALLRWLPW